MTSEVLTKDVTVIDLYKEVKEMRVELELFLSLILPEEEMTENEKKQVEAAEKEIKEGRFITLEQLSAELGEQ